MGEIVVSQRLTDERKRIVLSGEAGCVIDELALKEALSKIPDLAAIDSLIVNPSSTVRNLRFLESVPTLRALHVHGRHLESLEGLEWFERGRTLQIDTVENSHRSIERISTTNIETLVLGWANPGDLDAIARTASLRKVSISKCPPLSFTQWSDSALETLQLFGGSLTEIRDTSAIRPLRMLTLAVHRKLRRFAGDNANIDDLMIQECNALDVSSISTFPGLRTVTLVDHKDELPISTFAALAGLQALTLINCKVVLDTMDLRSSAPHLKDLHIWKLPKARVLELSKSNADVRVSNGVWECTNGNLERQ